MTGPILFWVKKEGKTEGRKDAPPPPPPPLRLAQGLDPPLQALRFPLSVKWEMGY